jgi:hypothetical protein
VSLYWNPTVARIRWVVGGLTLLILFLVLITARLWTRDSLALRQLTVKDELGNVVATLASKNSLTCLHLNGRQDATSVDLCADHSYGRFWICRTTIRTWELPYRPARMCAKAEG